MVSLKDERGFYSLLITEVTKVPLLKRTFHLSLKRTQSSMDSTFSAVVRRIVSSASVELYPRNVLLIALGFVIVFLYWLLFTPLNRVRDLVGYGYLEDESKRRGRNLRDLINEIRARRKINDIPPIYPNGWFALIESRDLNAGEAKPVSAIGENFVVFRTQDGTANVLDAYCPHLGAHLGVGGRVLGDCIECPFHGWQFDGEGKCTTIPYAEKVPSFAKVKKWQSFETNGFIFVWFHAEGEEPTWYPPVVREVNVNEWEYRGRTEHYINSHIEDIPENGGDLAHLPQVHSSSMMAGVDLRWMRSKLWDIGEHIWAGNWKECEEPDKHMAVLTMKHVMKFFGKFYLIPLNVQANQIGPSIVHLEMETYFGKAVLIQTVTPIAPLTMKVTHQFYCNRNIPRPFSKLIIFGEAVMFERDIMIWNSKTYMIKPLLVKEDKLLAKHRRWYSQFYSENSPRLKFAKDTIDW